MDLLTENNKLEKNHNTKLSKCKFLVIRQYISIYNIIFLRINISYHYFRTALYMWLSAPLL